LNKPARWIHFGDGPLREQALKSINSDRVIFECRGQTSNEDVRAFYVKEPVHCLVNLSIVEGLPVSIMEAISHGIPVIATAVYGVPEIVTNGYNGVELPVQFTNEQIDEALMLFMANPEQMATMRRNARTRYEELFNAEKNYNEFAKEIASLRL
jgi:glycosyltransferase involved in cell wall biosynthesis